MAPTEHPDDLVGDLYEFLRNEEKRAALERVQVDFPDQWAALKAYRHRPAEHWEDRLLPPEAAELWGEDESQWKGRITRLAAERAIDNERKRGTSEDVLEELGQVLLRLRERIGQTDEDDLG
jgi:hypothetical protein